jgi:hypothetical protein
MLNRESEQILNARGPGLPYKILKDVDGPGAGNSAVVDYEERPTEGGILIHLIGYKYPYDGLPDAESVERFRIVKKIFFYLLTTIRKKALISLGLIYIMPRFITKHLFNSIADYFYMLNWWVMYYIVLKPDKYCRSVREIYRALTVVADREKEESMKKLIGIARDIVCMFIEQDSAYKFRFQDIMAEADVCKLRRGGLGMIREIQRLVAILKRRELFPTYAELKWGNLQRLIVPMLMVTEIRHYAQAFFKEVDFNKLTPKENDLYFTSMRLDYEFGDVPLPQRIIRRCEMDRENWYKYNFDELSQLFLKEYNGHKQLEGGSNQCQKQSASSSLIFKH